MRLAEDVARALLVGVAVGEVPALLAAARPTPLRLEAEALAGALAREPRILPRDVALGDDAGGRRRELTLIADGSWFPPGFPKGRSKSVVSYVV